MEPIVPLLYLDTPLTEMVIVFQLVVTPCNLVPGNILQASTYFPISRNQGTVSLGVPLLSHPARLNDDGSIELFASLEVGEQITLMSGQPDNLIRRATEVTEVVFRTHELNYECRPKALIIVFCAIRYFINACEQDSRIVFIISSNF